MVHVVQTLTFPFCKKYYLYSLMPLAISQALLSTDLHEWLDHIRDPKADCISSRHLLLTLALQVARAVQDVHVINAVHCNIQVSRAWLTLGITAMSALTKGSCYL